jgi:hypothetical protein
MGRKTAETELKAKYFDQDAYKDFYNAPMFLRPRTTPTPIM